MKRNSVLSVVPPLIRFVRGQHVILDFDLARLYGVSTRRLNEQVGRNIRRFPDDFAFVLSRREAALMLSQIATASPKRNQSKPPRVFTEHGAVMAANVLSSDRAAAMSVEIVRAFIQLRKLSASHEKIAKILTELENAVSKRLDRHDREIDLLFRLLETSTRANPEDSRKEPGFGSA
jgi:hypothetical protein